MKYTKMRCYDQLVVVGIRRIPTFCANPQLIHFHFEGESHFSSRLIVHACYGHLRQGTFLILKAWQGIIWLGMLF